MPRLTIRIDFGDGSALGPGKVRLLEQIGETGSIRKAAAAMKMSYRRAWMLLKALDTMFGAPLAATATGGKAGGGATLTPLGKAVVQHYRSLEKAVGKAGAGSAAALDGLLPAAPAKPPVRRSIRGKPVKISAAFAKKPIRKPR